MSARHVERTPLTALSWLLRATVIALAVGAIVALGGDTVRAEGLTANGSQMLWQGAAGIPGTAAANEFFGASLAAGDFDGNGYEDLAIGVGSDNSGEGSVTVRYHNSGGVLWTETWLASHVTLVELDNFGQWLAAGDFNGDGYDDLAVGAYGGEVESESIHTLFGDPVGLGSITSELEGPDLFAYGFVAGDFNGDAYDDLAMWSVNPDTVWWSYGNELAYMSIDASHGQNFHPQSLAAGDANGNGVDELAVGFATANSFAGFVRVYYDGSTFIYGQWDQDSPGIIGANEAGDRFGHSVAFGDADGDGYDDLFAGVVGEETTHTDMGAVQRIPGSGSGLTEVGNQLYGAGSATEAGAFAGWTIATGDFDGSDAGDEVAVGVPFDDINGAANAGSVWVLFSGATNRYWHQDVAGIDGTAEADDRFGGGNAAIAFHGSMASGDFNGDGADDLAIGVPEEDIGAVADAGAVNILYGTPAGPLDTDGDGCPDVNEQQTAPGSQTSGGLRDYLDPNDYYDVLGFGGAQTHDGVIDLANDILGVILHYSPQGQPPYDVRFDRGPTAGPNAWNMTAPDGVIDLPNDILGVILQFGHNCV